MTNREFFEAVSAGKLTEEVTQHAAAELVKMDERKAKRASTPSKTAVENAPIMRDLLTNCKENAEVARPAADIGAAVGISTAKASSLLRKLTEGGYLTQTEGKAGKGKGKVKFYQFAADMSAEDAESVPADEGENEDE